MNWSEAPVQLCWFDYVPSSGETEESTYDVENHIFDNPPPKVQIPGARFCLSGTFTCCARGEWERLIKERGGVIQSFISHATDYLVVGTYKGANWRTTKGGIKVHRVHQIRQQHSQGLGPSIVSERTLFNQLF